MSTGADVLPDLAGTLVDRRDMARTQASVLEGLFGIPREPTRIGRFELLGTVGSGAMGRVYAARDPRLDRRVAIKLLRPDIAAGPLAAARRRRLVAEAQALARLSHPNVVEVFEVGTEGAEVYVVMELVDGASLRQWLAREQPEPSAIVDAFVAAGRGLAAAHAAGIVHRDFKPDNVLVGHDGRVRVADFGVAIASADDSSAGSPASLPSGTGLSQTVRGAAGTPGYVAPEVLSDGFADARSDLFSFCVSLVEALTGKRPSGPEDVPALPLSPGASAMVSRGLERDPDARPASMALLVASLEGKRRPLTWLLVVASGVLVVPAMAAATAMGWGGGSTQCGPIDGSVEPVWNDQRRASLRAALEQGQPTFGPQTWERAEPRIDAYVSAVAQRRHAACEHAASPSALAEADECAATRLSDLDTVLALFERREAQPQYLIAALDRLADTTGCDQAGHVPGQAALQAQLVHAQALSAAGSERGPTLAAAVRQRAADLGDQRTVIEADIVLGISEANTGASESEPDRLRSAYFAATTLGDPALATRAAIALGYHAAVYRSDLDGAHAWAEHAHTQIQRTDDPKRRRTLEVQLTALHAKLALDHRDAWTGLSHVERALTAARRDPESNPAIEVRLLRMRGQAMHRLGRVEEALRNLEEAHTALEARLGAGHPDTLSAASDIATMLFQTSRYDEAHARTKQVVAGLAETLGPDNTRIGTMLTLLGAIEGARGDYESAQATLLQANEIMIERFGEEHHRVALNYLNLSEVDLQLGDLPAAIRHREKVVDIDGRLFGEDSPRMAPIYNAMGQLYTSAGEPDKAVASHQRALEVAAGSDAATEGQISAYLGLARAQGDREPNVAIDVLERALPLIADATGTDSEDYAIALTNIAALQVIADRPAEALGPALQALAVYEKIHGPDHPDVAYALLAAADAEVAHGDPDSAIPHAQRAVALREDNERVPDYLTARAQLVLARALWLDPARRGDARALAGEARTTLRAAGEDGVPGLDELEAWEASR